MILSMYFKRVLVLFYLLHTTLFVRAQYNQSGFISIDCGIPKGSNYTDRITTLNYVSDVDFIDSGEIHSILATYKSSDPKLTTLNTLTSFPENDRNCYTLKPANGKGYKYLIRARFLYGNYDLLDKLPEFDVYLGPNYWDTLKFNSSATPVNMEMIYMSSSDYIHVCLLNTGRGTPFVSAIELRLLESNMYPQTDFGSLYVYKYADFGNAGELRYKPDSYDRLWSPATLPNTSPLYTSNKISPGRSTITLPPSRVMSTAITPTSPTDTLSITWNKRNASNEFLVYLHFAEIEMLNRTQNREFNIYLNGNITYGPFSPLNHTTTTFYYSTKPENNAHTYTLTISKTENSTLPPIVNALELYTLKQLPQRQTYDQDASAMWSIKSSYKLTKNWQGDPCTPQKFVWDGLRCGSDDQDFPRVTFLNLSNSGLSGEIDSRIANLTMIDTLDLSNNNLTGTVPNFLSELNFLKVLNLKGNNFIGPVPEELQAKSDQGSLLLSFDDENARDAASYCDGNTCESKKNKRIIVPIIATVAFICMIFIVSVAIWMFKKQKAHGSGLHIRKQQYTYSEVQTITNNFNVVIGKGGSGTVYHGRIGNTQVAVKMLSESSDQGEKQFQAEANLLQSVHHKNLTSFVGYCNEEKHKGIIYEYMANGNLEKHLFDTSSSILDWEQRLQIGCDAAHGLEYLHHGCKPPIVHRDIKCTNILLNGTFQAKLADFGLSRAFPIDSDDTHISTIVAGTPGYLDPEYHITSRLTEKNDIYSFGVVLLVIITGQPAVTRYENDNIHISQWVSLKLSEGDMKSIVDPKVGDFDINSAWRAVEVAMACVVDTPNSRPTMNKVVMELKDCLVIERARKETESSNLTEFVSLNLESVYDPNPR